MAEARLRVLSKLNQSASDSLPNAFLRADTGDDADLVLQSVTSGRL